MVLPLERQLMQLGMYEAVPEAGQVPPKPILTSVDIVMRTSGREYRMIFLNYFIITEA